MFAPADPIKRHRLKKTLIIAILATIPCYLLGLIIAWIGNTVKNQPTQTPTVEFIITEGPLYVSPTLPVPTAIFATFTLTPTPTEGPTPTPSATYFIPSPTPSYTATFTPTFTATASNTPPPPTEIPAETTTEPPP
jgi:hypothetical protein